MSDLRVALRTAVKVAIENALVGSAYEGIPVVYRPTRKLVQVPAITFSDSGEKVDDVVPLYRRTWDLDLWTRLDLDDAEALAHLVNSALDHRPIGVSADAPELPGAEGLVVFLMLQSDRDLPQEDADFTRKMLTYTMLVYEWNGPEPA